MRLRDGLAGCRMDGDRGVDRCKVGKKGGRLGEELRCKMGEGLDARLGRGGGLGGVYLRG